MRSHVALTAGRWLVCLRLRRRLRSVLDASRRRHLADRRFFQLLTDADR